MGDALLGKRRNPRHHKGQGFVSLLLLRSSRDGTNLESALSFIDKEHFLFLIGLVLTVILQ